MRETLSRYFELAREVIGRYGGNVEKFIGDAVMAVWGAPTAQEDDAERAVRAALDLVSAVPQLGPGIQARAGVLTGEAAVTVGANRPGHGGRGPGEHREQIAVGGRARHRSRRRVDTACGEQRDRVRAPDDQTLKGKAAPVAAWRAMRVVAERGGRNRSEQLEAPFVGREDEMRLLKELFHATNRERRPRLVSVIGPGGIGKSRLAWEFLKYVDGLQELILVARRPKPVLRRGHHVLGARRDGPRASRPARGRRRGGDAGKIAETVANVVADEEQRTAIERALLALLGFESGVDAQQLLRRVAHVLREAGRPEPRGDGLRGSPLRRPGPARLHRSPARMEPLVADHDRHPGATGAARQATQLGRRQALASTRSTSSP